MSFKFELTESVEEGTRRIAREQLEKAIDELTDSDRDQHKAVHQVRKRCKKLRGLLRLVRLSLDNGIYETENACFRDAASDLSSVRDAQTLVDTYDDLLSRFDTQLQEDAFTSIRKQLVERRTYIAKEEVGLQDSLDEFLSTMREAQARVDKWKLDGKGFDALEPGLRKTYERACKAMELAHEEPTTENFHEWRKRSKYHWYHSRLLEGIWPSELEVRCKAAKTLSDYLGDDHDLAILRETISDKPGDYGSKKDIQAFVALIDRRRNQLQSKAFPLGQRLFSESAKKHAKRLRAYWVIWQREREQDRF